MAVLTLGLFLGIITYVNGDDVGCFLTERNGRTGHCVRRGCCRYDFHVTDPDLCDGANEVCCYQDNICGGGGYTCYGDMMRLSPTGASAATARQDRLGYTGPRASQTMVGTDYNELNRLRNCYFQVGNTLCVHPALIAALASRESRGGRLLRSRNGWGDCGSGTCRAYGILQCDIHTSGLGQRCTSHPWDSCAHMEMMIREVFLDKVRGVQRRHPSWLRERQLQGGVAAYNFGVSNVRSWERLDIGTTGNDYSNDVMARAQHLVRNYGWS